MSEKLNSNPPSRNRLDSESGLMRTYLDQMGQHELLTAEQEVTLAQAMEVGLKAADAIAAIENSDGTPDPADYDKWQSEIEQGKRARQTFINSNLKLVVSIAKKYPHPNLDFMDLIQEGNLGLMRAVDKFEYQRGFKFSTYATWWIRQSITRCIAEKSRTINVPVYLHDMEKTVSGTQANLKQTLGRAPTLAEIADESGLSLAKVKQASKIPDASVSLFAPVGEGDAVIGDFVLDEEAIDPESAAMIKASEELLAHIFDTALSNKVLSQRDAQVLTYRFGLWGTEGMTLEAIGERLHVTRERVRQIVAESLRKISRQASLMGLEVEFTFDQKDESSPNSENSLSA